MHLACHATLQGAIERGDELPPVVDKPRRPRPRKAQQVEAGEGDAAQAAGGGNAGPRKRKAASAAADEAAGATSGGGSGAAGDAPVRKKAKKVRAWGPVGVVGCCGMTLPF